MLSFRTHKLSHLEYMQLHPQFARKNNHNYLLSGPNKHFEFNFQNILNHFISNL